MPQIKDLSIETQNALLSDFLYWDGYRTEAEQRDLDFDINAETPCVVSGVGHYLASYLIVYCILADNKSALTELCESGAKLDVQDRRHANKTPLEIAVSYGRADIVSLLLKYGAKHSDDIDTPNASCCAAPSTFFWSMREKLAGRQVDYGQVRNLLIKNL